MQTCLCPRRSNKTLQHRHPLTSLRWHTHSEVLIDKFTSEIHVWLCVFCVCVISLYNITISTKHKLTVTLRSEQKSAIVCHDLKLLIAHVDQPCDGGSWYDPLWVNVLRTNDKQKHTQTFVFNCTTRSWWQRGKQTQTQYAHEPCFSREYQRHLHAFRRILHMPQIHCYNKVLIKWV